jgi:hypothetical protein
MNHNAPPIPTQLVVSATVALAGIIAYVAALLIEEEQREVQESLLAQSLALLRESRKRRARAVGDGPRKKSYIMWDRDRARECIMEDYLGNVPRFNDVGFKRMFRVSRQKYDELRSILCNSDPFFRDSIDARNRRSISIDAKILISLKYISYGTAINAFRDYFQMGESTSRLCVKHFVRGVLRCDALRDKYFRKMS